MLDQFTDLARARLNQWLSRRQAAIPPQLVDPVHFLNSLYKAALRRTAKPEEMARDIERLQSGISPETLAQELVNSEEFQNRHEFSQKVDFGFLIALYRDLLGREPDPEGLAGWLALGENGATHATVIVEFARSPEAIAKASLPVISLVPNALLLDKPRNIKAVHQPIPRREKLLFDLDLELMRGLEIGPLASPIISKNEFQVLYVDHADRETLCQKYKDDPNVDVDKIVSVDAVWGERTLLESFPSASSFDYVIASHVIEHVPDIIGWLNEIAAVLAVDGYLSLAIPDKRFTFDYLRHTTRLSEAVDAYLRHNRRPMPAQIFDYNANAVEVNLSEAWSGKLDIKSLRHYVDLRFALDRSLEAVTEGKYIDSHCWVFTPSSLLTLFADFVDLALVPYYRCSKFYETEPGTNEMVMVLRRIDNNLSIGKEEAKKSFLSHLEHLRFIERD